MADLIAQAFDDCERIGVVGSPSTTNELTVDLLGTAVDKRLVGALCVFKYTQDATDHYALGQVSEVKLYNPWTQDPTMRGLIRRRGRVDPVTEKQDTHIAIIYLSAIFATGTSVSGSMFGTVPPTGTSVRLVSQKLIDNLLRDYANQVVYLGHAYGTGLLLPMWLKHFGRGPGGAGEAYHIGIFGKTGSGKSYLAKMILMGYAKHNAMSIIVFDPQGEFSKLGEDGAIQDAMKKVGRQIEVYDLSSIVLTDSSSNFELFGQILSVSGFLDRLSIFSDENKERAANEIREILKSRQPTLDGAKINPWDLAEREVFNRVWAALGTTQIQSNIYTSADPRGRLNRQYQTVNVEEMYSLWSRVAKLFSFKERKNSLKIPDLVAKVTTEGKSSIAVIDLSETHVPDYLFWNEKIRLIVIEKILSVLERAAEESYKQDKTLNLLVMIDEAHRLAPRDLTEDETHLLKVRRALVDGALTTRKFGLGWMFISPTLSGVDSGIVTQLRIEIFGFGLGWGVEGRSLRDIIAGKEDAISLYQMFKDPQSVLGEKEYSFMTVGPVSPLSFSGSPLFFNSLRFPDEFLKENERKMSNSP
jgi:DNA helicase HerA-like ATPase